MDIRQLRYFLGVLEAKSITRAAASLHVAQPAIGMQLRNLEEELGVKLLIRHSRGVEPTEAGKRLKKHAEELIGKLALARQDVLEVGTEPRGQIALGMTTNLVHVLFAPIIRASRRKYPAIALNCIEAVSELLSESLVAGKLDVALTYGPPTDPGFVSEALAVETLYLAVPIDHPLATAPAVTHRQALECELIVTSRISLQRTQIEEAADKYGTNLLIGCEVGSVLMIKEFVRSGLGCSISAYGVMLSDVEAGLVAMLPISDVELNRTLYFSCAKRRRNSKVLKAIYREIQTVVDEIIAAQKIGWAAPPKGRST